MRKITLLYILIACCFGVYFTQNLVVSSILDIYLKRYCRTCFNGELSHGGIRYENDTWVIDSPEFVVSNEIGEKKHRFFAEDAQFKYEIAWLELKIDMAVSLTEPQLDIAVGANELRQLFELPSGELGFFTVHSRFTIPKGSLVLKDEMDKDSSISLVHFSADMTSREETEGAAVFWFSSAESDEAAKRLEILVSKQGPDDQAVAQVEINADDISCESLLVAIRHIWPDWTGCNITEGTLFGNARFLISQNSLPYGEGTLRVKNLELFDPVYELSCTIPELSFDLSPENNGSDSLLSYSQATGRIDVSKAATINFFKNGLPYSKIEDLVGSLTFNTYDFATLSLEATLAEGERRQKLHIGGQADLAEEDQSNFTMELHLQGETDDQESLIHLASGSLKEGWSFIDADIKHLDKETFELIQHLFRKTHPDFENVEVNDGLLDASFVAYLEGKRLSEVKFDHFAAHHLDMNCDAWNIAFGCKKVVGTFSLDCSKEDVWQTVCSDMNISGGHLCLAGHDEAIWQFSNINSEFAVRNGVVQKTRVKAKIAGLTGEIEIDGNSPKEIARLDFKGSIVDMRDAVPQAIRNGLYKTFTDDQIRVLASVKKKGNGALVKGKLFLTDSVCSLEEMEFGFSLEKPFFAITDGWFKGSKLPLERVLSPFLFQEDQMYLSGVGEFKGVFDETFVKVDYDAEEVVLENDDFCIEVKRFERASGGQSFACTHLFDLKNMRSQGSFPIVNGTYFEKNSGLLFTGVDAEVSLQDDRVNLLNVEAFCNGIFFGGDIEIDCSMPGIGVFEVGIDAKKMEGRVSQVQDFFSHFDKSLFLLNLPIDGNVQFQGQEGRIHFSFKPDDYILSTTLNGAISDGTMTSQTGNVSLHDLGLNFFYDHQKSLLNFSNIQGAVLVGSPGHVEEYVLEGEGISFTDFANDQAVFDFSVRDKEHEVMRVAGRSTPQFDSDGSKALIDVRLDQKLSHFGDVHPDIFQMALKDWSNVDTLRLELKFQLSALLKDLQCFSRTGFFFLSRSLLKELNEVKNAEGNFQVDIGYDSVSSEVGFNVVGTDARIDSYATRDFLLNGKKRGGNWSIDQLKFGDISLAADISKQAEMWNIQFLGARIGQFLLLGLEGSYQDDNSLLNARVNLLEVDLKSAKEWPFLKSIFEDHSLVGELSANGSLSLQFDRAQPMGVLAHSQLNCSLSRGSWRGLQFQDFDNAILEYHSQSGFSLKGIDTALKSVKDDSIKASILVQEIRNNFVKEEIEVNHLSFSAPAKHLLWLTENLQQSFPDLFSPSLVEIVQKSKTDGDLKGNINLEFSGPHVAFRLCLDDGIYRFLDRDHDFSHFVMEYDPFEMKVSTKYRCQRHQCWLTSRSPVPSLNRGETIFSEDLLDPEVDSSTFPLTINWELDPVNGFIVQNIAGALCGVQCDLVRDENHLPAKDQLYLKGDVQFDLSKARALLDEELDLACSSWEVGRGYYLKGEWAFAKDEKPFAENVTFQGELLGRDFEAAGYQFYNLSAHIGYSGNALRVRHFSIVDPCGGMQIDDIMLSKLGDGSWAVAVPKIMLSEFRPSLLHGRRTPPPTKRKALVIRQFEMHDLAGMLGDRTSYTGKGRFLFHNAPKKNLQHTIFAIPAELLTRLGLDLSVLTPVRGVVHYDIKDAKMIFTRSKDIFSKGRLSKFYLSHSNFQSYMDFDGNLNLKVRMKQYNIFFKLAELFTFTVRGTVAKPIYSIHKQPRPERQGALKLGSSLPNLRL